MVAISSSRKETIGFWPFSSLCLFTSRMRLCTRANFSSPLYFLNSALFRFCKSCRRTMISSSAWVSSLNFAIESITNPCSLNRSIKASRNEMNSGSSWSKFWVKERMVRCHFSFSSIPPDIRCISSCPILEKVNSISIMASLISVFVSSPTLKASFWLMIAMRLCTSDNSCGNLVISSFANRSFISSSPKVRTIFAIFFAASNACFRSRSTVLSSSVEISDENSSALS